MALVPDRSCGGCTVCCRVPPIDTPELQKTSGVLCGFCVEGRGCGVHATRPPVCREWFCGWRSLPLLDDAWRPDRCGVLIALGADEVPTGLGPYQSTKFIVTDGGTWLSDRGFLSYVSGLVHAGAATYLAAVGPPGFHQAKALVNPRLQTAVADRDGRGIVSEIRRVFEALRRGPFEPVALSDAPLSPASSPGSAAF